MRQGSSKSLIPQDGSSSNGGYFMEPIHLFEKAEFSSENFIPKQLHIGETCAAVLLCFEPGQAMPLHPHPGTIEVILYGLEGDGTLAIGDAEKPLRKGDLIFCKGEVPVGPKNIGNGRFMVMVVLVVKKLISQG